MKSIAWPLVVAVALFTSCSKRDAEVSFSFYSWKQKFELSEKQKDLLENLQAEKIYLKYFDVVTTDDGLKARSVSVVEIKDSISQEIIPVVYIKNEVFQKLSAEELNDLPLKVMKGVTTFHFSSALKELQIDCDWTQTTREAYFSFLQSLHALDSNVVLSATIRLHQVKYRSKTGVPPVDKGVLMYYNMGEVKDAGERNSIFDRGLAESYTENLDTYPLPLDYALPAYSWVVQREQGRVKELLQTLTEEKLADDTLLQKTKDNVYISLSGHFNNGFYFKEGDELIVEKVSSELCLQAAKSIRKKIKQEKIHILFFELNHPNLNEYTVEDFAAIREALR